jgi:hypothetical protein
MTEMSVGSGSSLTLINDAIGPDDSTGSVWLVKNFIAGSSYMGFGGQYLSGPGPQNVTPGQYKISLYAKVEPDSQNKFFTLWYWSGTKNIVSEKYETDSTWRLFEFEATFNSGSNHSIGISNVPDDYETNIYIWGFSLQHVF